MFYLKNLSAIETLSGKPWEFDKLDLVPAHCLGKDGKKLRSEWITAPVTDFHVYSLFEGVNSNCRIRRDTTSAAQDGNPPAFMHGLAIDYDFPLTEAEIEAGIARMEYKPNWRETTLSGNCRLIWLFSQPVPIPSYDFAVGLLESLDDIVPFRNLAGIDEGALKAPERYFTNGCRWQKINPYPFPWAVLLGHIAKFSEKFNWRGVEFGHLVPLPLAAERLRSKYPEFSTWPGDFSLGAQGPSFWVPGSTSPKSAIVRETGIQSFSAHAHKAFFNWSELLGADYVEKFKTAVLGEAVKDIFYDDRDYYSCNGAGEWLRDSKENIINLLRNERGLSEQKRKGEPISDLDRGLFYIQRCSRVAVASKFAFYPKGFVEIGGEKVLNLHTRDVMRPAEPGGDCPFLKELVYTIFSTPEQADYFLSWFSYFYKACYHRTPRSGQAVFIAGPTNMGKTLITRGVVGPVMGGFAEANDYLTGSDNFSSDLFEKAVWAIDDGTVAGDLRSHKRFSEMVKRMTANPTFRCNGKFLKANLIHWQGRVMVTLNVDAESARQLPDLDISLREKVMMFRTRDERVIQFYETEKMQEILRRELPHFCRFLLDYKIPAHCQADDPRYGVRSYLEESLVDSANHSSASGAFAEILDDWMGRHFRSVEPFAIQWKGTALQLYKAILTDHTMIEPMKPFGVQSVGRTLTSLAAKKVFDISYKGCDSKREFTIKRDLTTVPLATTRVVPQTEGSSFEKTNK